MSEIKKLILSFSLFILAIGVFLFSSPLPISAQVNCPSLASLSITAPFGKTSYLVNETIIGEVVFTNNTAPVTVIFNATVSKDGQVILSKLSFIQTQLGRNAWSIKEAFGSDTLPSAGTYTLSVIASYTPLDCTWNANLQLTAMGGPHIDSLNPSSAPFGSTITINGSGFTPTGNQVKSGNTVIGLNVSSTDGKTLTFTVPDVPAVFYPISVSNINGTSNEAIFTVIPAIPQIQSLNPASGQPFTQITVKGINFTRTGNDVKSGSTVIASNVPSNGTVLNFTVPDVSPGTYPISVQNQRGTSNEVSFTVLAPPPVKLLTSLTILPSEYLLGQTVTGSVVLTNPITKEIKADFSIELYKDTTLFWQRRINGVSIPPSPGPAPKVISFSLDSVFGFKPTIPDEPSFVGNWKLLIRRTDTPQINDSVFQTFAIKAPIVQPLTLTFNFDPKEYVLGDTLQGKGTVSNPGSSPVKADFKIELFQATVLKWQREIKDISIPSGTAKFTFDDLFGAKVVIPNEVSLIGDWKLKITQVGTTPEVAVEATFKIQGLTAACKPTTGKIDPGIFGIQASPLDPWNYDIRTADFTKELGTKWARVFLAWSDIEPSKGNFNWEFYDKLVEEFYKRDINILFYFDSKPEWVKGASWEDFYQYTNRLAYEVAKHYKLGGDLSKSKGWQNYGVRYWEIFNEPNFAEYFIGPSADPQKYAIALAYANEGIRRADPSAVILNGGLSNIGVPPQDFLKRIYGAGAKDCFDVVSYHPYGADPRITNPDDPRGFAGIVKIIKDISAQYGVSKPVWFTEYSMTTPGGKPDEDFQVGMVKEAYKAKDIPSALFFFSLRDLSPKPNDTYGLLRFNWSKKPAFDVLKNLLKGITPSPGISINVDASKEGRNIAELKRGHNFEEMDHKPYNLQLYEKDIGYSNALVRLHSGMFLRDDKEKMRWVIEQLLKIGKPDLMFDIMGMPKHLASKYTEEPERFGCLSAWATTPPKDYNQWKEYVKGWVNTLKPYGIKYWEIWNEPADTQSPGCFWSGTEAEYFQLYKKTVEAIREAYGGAIPADVKIGGPALSGIDGKIYGSSEYLFVSLPRFLGQNNLPLDFFSWHKYDQNPLMLKQNDIVAKVRAELRKNGFSQTELIIDEYTLGSKDFKHATVLAGEFVQMAQQGIDRQSVYTFYDKPWEPDFPWGQNLFKWAGLFGISDNLITKASFNFFKAINKMGDTMIDVSSQPSTAADYVLATKSSDRVSAMVVNYQDAKASVPLTIKNVPQNFTKYTKYIIDATHSNAYAVESRIKTRMDQGKSEALTFAKDAFSAALKERGWNFFKIFLAKGQLDKYFANPDDPDVKAWLDSLSSQERDDVIFAFGSAMDKYNLALGPVADEINNWPEVKLYSETKTVSIPSGVYQETLNMEPYAVQVIALSN